MPIQVSTLEEYHHFLSPCLTLPAALWVIPCNGFMKRSLDISSVPRLAPMTVWWAHLALVTINPQTWWHSGTIIDVGGSCGCVAAPVPQATPSIHNFVFNEALGSARRSHSMQRGGLSKRNVTGSKRFQVELTLGLNIRVYLLLRLKEAGEGGITVKARFAPSTIQNFFLLHI
jgi:hypothetical protein